MPFKLHNCLIVKFLFVLKQIAQENAVDKVDVIVKKVEPIKIASVRVVIPTYRDQISLWRELEIYLSTQCVRPAGPSLVMYYTEGYREHNVDIEVAEPISANLPEGRRVRVRTLPAAEVVSAIHHGPYQTLGETIETVLKWAETNGYRIVGPEREIYLQPARNGSQTDPEAVTEIQFPVEKA
jgi:effector-binding domain-containing protein